MTISKDLLLAVLSMDAYNRGYGAGMSLTGSQIASLSISVDSTDLLKDPVSGSPVDQAHGFYAISYEVTDNSIAGLSNN
jgi:hypothetical protein